MAIRFLEAVLYKLPDVTARGPAFCLIAIADSADRDSGWTFNKTTNDIARAARLTERGAREAIRWLCANRYIRAVVEGPAGYQHLRFRVLFDSDGNRKPEAELYPPGAVTSPGGKRTGATTSPRGAATSPPGAPTSPGGATTSPPICTTSSPSLPSSPKDGQKAGAEARGRSRDRIREMTDEQLEERARTGQLTAQEERERELRKLMRAGGRRGGAVRKLNRPSEDGSNSEVPAGAN